MISVPHTLCSRGYDGRFFKCATLIVYEMCNGRSRSSMVRHDVERDVEGRLQTAIVNRRVGRTLCPLLGVSGRFAFGRKVAVPRHELEDADCTIGPDRQGS
jgi:hypothetical protein